MLPRDDGDYPDWLLNATKQSLLRCMADAQLEDARAVLDKIEHAFAHRAVIAAGEAGSLEEVAERLAAVAQKVYDLHGERSAMRCALGDAATLCDVLATKLEEVNRVRGNRISKQGQEWAVIAKRCGNAIWEMRARIIHSGGAP